MKRSGVRTLCMATIIVCVAWTHATAQGQPQVDGPLVPAFEEQEGARAAESELASSITLYRGRRIFESLHPGLALEDFEDFTDAFAVCDAPADSTTACPGGWQMGAILPGLVIDCQQYSGPGNFGLAVIPTGFDGNDSIELATAFFTDRTVVELQPAVDAVGFDVACHPTAEVLQAEVYDGDGVLVWSDTVAPCESIGAFVGWDTTAAPGIGRIELFEPTGVSREAIDDVVFGDVAPTVFPTRSGFDEDNPDLPVEDFQDFVDVLRVCDAPAESGTQCIGAWGPRDVLPGLAIDCTFNSGPGNNGVVVIPTGAFGNDSIVMASTYEPDETVIVLSPAASAVGLDVACYPAATSISIEVLDRDGGLAWGGNLSPCAETGAFIGWSTTSRKGLARIELLASIDSREMVDDIAVDTVLIFKHGFEIGTLGGWDGSVP